ncbi:Uncharacterised protein [Listeria monocytogenes]|jgi:hypothetical protein|nr:Uncharacterised protein [Listeria monocytogenes]CWW15756.1 Uncharacterised protein [Listeria monocytogenes]
MKKTTYILKEICLWNEYLNLKPNYNLLNDRKIVFSKCISPSELI